MNVGDFGFFEFKLCQIKEMDEMKITSVSDGSFVTGSYYLSDRWFPLSLKNITISDYFEYYNRKLHESKFHQILNYPDIHRYIVDVWVDACNAKTNTSIIEYEDKLKKFFDETIELCESAKKLSVNGVRVIGR